MVVDPVELTLFPLFVLSFDSFRFASVLEPLRFTFHFLILGLLLLNALNTVKVLLLNCLLSILNSVESEL